MAGSLQKFGEFELDHARYELRCEGRVLKLERIPMELLLLLLEKDGAVVTREAIIDRLWGKDVFVDTEHGINTAIRKVRAALREDAEHPRFVQTVQGKGYRFVVSQRDDHSQATKASVVSTGPAAVAGETATQPAQLIKPQRHWQAALATLLGCLVAGLLLKSNAGGIRDRIFADRNATSIHSVAVLPLSNLSGDPAQDYFAEGMTDELITMLAKNTDLRVVSRTSAMQYKGARRPLPEIAKELGVDGIVEGSVERSGSRLHMTVQLIRAQSDTHIWAESYDRDLEQAFALPLELSQAIARQANSGVTARRPPRYVNPDAHDAYLRGRFFWFRENYGRSQEYFEKAIQIQADYAAAWSGLSDAYIVRAVAGRAPLKDVATQAEQAARKAVELDDTLPEAHNALAAVELFEHWDWRGADAESRRAIELNPSFAEAHHLHSYVLFAANQPQEGLREQQQSSEIDPFARPWALGWAYIKVGQYEAAIDELRAHAEAVPEDAYLHFFLSQAYAFKGANEDSVRELEEGVRLVSNEKKATQVRQAFERGGAKGVAEWGIHDVEARARRGYVSPYLMALQYAWAGKKNETLKCLEDAYREHSPLLVFLQYEHELDFVHADGRYKAIVKNMGMLLPNDPS